MTLIVDDCTQPDVKQPGFVVADELDVVEAAECDFHLFVDCGLGLPSPILPTLIIMLVLRNVTHSNTAIFNGSEIQRIIFYKITRRANIINHRLLAKDVHVLHCDWIAKVACVLMHFHNFCDVCV